MADAEGAAIRSFFQAAAMSTVYLAGIITGLLMASALISGMWLDWLKRKWKGASTWRGI